MTVAEGLGLELVQSTSISNLQSLLHMSKVYLLVNRVVGASDLVLTRSKLIRWA